MFYNRFMEICREYGEKPTPVLKKLDISPGNLKRWEGGASITADTLEKIADYFGVSVDYFFLKDDEAVFTEVQQNEMAIKNGKNGISSDLYYCTYPPRLHCKRFERSGADRKRAGEGCKLPAL